MTREEAARAFAERMGWYVLEQLVPGGTNLILDPMFVCGFVTNDRGLPRNDLPLPAPDAPLHEKLAFVGRVAEAIGAAAFAVDMRRHTFAEVGPIAVTFKVEDGWCYSDEVCHAALLAALAALESR